MDRSTTRGSAAPLSTQVLDQEAGSRDEGQGYATSTQICVNNNGEFEENQIRSNERGESMAEFRGCPADRGLTMNGIAGPPRYLAKIWR